MHWITSDDFLRHETGPHPERPARLTAVRRVEAEERLGRVLRPSPPAPAPIEAILAVHSREMIDRLVGIAASGGGLADPDTVVSPRSVDVALLAAGAAIRAADLSVDASGGDALAFAAVRPPGHHATPERAMGFCLVNHVAVAARHLARERGLSRLLIVDFDVHHGNGTQDVFWEDPSVHFVSSHRYPFYPGSGAASERGGGEGLGATRNVPVAAGTPPRVWLERLFEAMNAAAAAARPEAILVSAGFDADARDPIGDLGLSPADFGRIGEEIRRLADRACGGRVVSILEGGYHLEALAEGVEAYVRGLEGGPSA